MYSGIKGLCFEFVCLFLIWEALVSFSIDEKTLVEKKWLKIQGTGHEGYRHKIFGSQISSCLHIFPSQFIFFLLGYFQLVGLEQENRTVTSRKGEVSEWRVRGWRVHTSILPEEVTVRHKYRDGNWSEEDAIMTYLSGCMGFWKCGGSPCSGWVQSLWGWGAIATETQGHLASRREEGSCWDRYGWDRMVFQNLDDRESKRQDSPFGVGSKKIKMRAGEVWL